MVGGHCCSVPGRPPAKPGAVLSTASNGLSAAGEGRGAAADRTSFLAATELGPLRVPLPSSLAATEVAIDRPAPLPFAVVTERIASAAGVPVEVEERPARVAGGAAHLPEAPELQLSFEGRLPGLLNLVAARSGYDWTYQGVPLWSGGAIVFYRYRDVQQRAPQVAAANRDDVLHRGDSLWIVDPARHETLLDVLKDWGSDAGWSVVWNSGRRYAVRAGASFEGTFLDAVDLLMAAPATRRSLVAMAYEPNRHLVVDDAEALR